MRVTPLPPVSSAQGSNRFQKYTQDLHQDVPSESVASSDDLQELFSTGRSCCIDTICSIRFILILFTIVSLVLTCLMIWIIQIVLWSQNIALDIGVISMVVWPCCLMAILISVASICIISRHILSKPLNLLTLQIYNLRYLKLDSIKVLRHLLKEYIPLFVIFRELASLMKEIRSFIPETLLNNMTEENQEEEERRREEQLRQMRAKIFQHQSSKNSISSHQSIGSHSKGSNSLPSASLAVSQNTELMTLRSAVASVATDKTGKSATLGKTVQLGLGLSSYIATTIVIQLRNYDGQCYPIITDLSAVFTMFFQKVQTVSRQFKGRCTIISPKIVMVSFESGKNIEKNALLCALQLGKQIEAVNEQLRDQVNLPTLQYGIGVSRSECLVGNIGTSQTKYAACIGNCPSNALRLASLNETFGTTILTDDSLLIALQGFVSRPVHMVMKKSIMKGVETLSLDGDDAKQTIYQLISEKKVNEDEWLYQLHQETEQSKYDRYSCAFDLLKDSVNDATLEEILRVFTQYLQSDPNDKVISLLYTQLKEIQSFDEKQIEARVKELCLDNCSVVKPMTSDSIL
ncbi:hypothetical protein FDP41_011863 [Naegleria fowleri]|uniref:Guanylate cyclase domain-containing protein n=1 Tax=Naegleria fowleri TaxID=5763 RepID=A0A6A5C5C7_NAEFO|nr:uncharacterized protein FDP41_011863 [Naegleria fowleri]KAF0982002.1 hypothetical protein FDP41_011863 [Naegleria fowleri]